MKIHFRQAVPEDVDFLYRLHRETMQRYVEQTWGKWDEDWQRARFSNRFAPERLEIILVEGQPAGVWQIQERNEEIYLVTIEIFPEYQKQGIGTTVIRQMIDRAVQQGKPVALQVLKVNVKAREFYQRLGFGVTGENETHYILAYHRQWPGKDNHSFNG